MEQSARELNEAELQQQLVNVTLCARMNVQALTRWRYDGSASSAKVVVHQIVVNDDAVRAMDRSPNRVFLLPGARAAGTRWFPPWLKWLLLTILTLSFVMIAVGYMMAAAAVRQLGQEFTHVGWEFTRVVGLLAADPQAAGVVLKEVLSGVLSGEELTHVAEEVTRMVGLLSDDPKTAGVVLKEVLSGALGVEHWPAASKVNLWTKNEVVNGVMRQTDNVKLSDGIEGVARVLVELLKLLGDDRETVARTLAGVLEKLGDDREALADTATEIMYGVLGDSPESAVVFLKDFLGGVFAGDAKPGPAWLDGEGDGHGRGPNWEMEMLADLADARSKSGVKTKQLEEAISWVGGQGWQESLAQQEVESAKWFKELHDSQVRRDRDAAAQDARWRSGGWGGGVFLALVIGLVAAMFLNRRAEGV